MKKNNMKDNSNRPREIIDLISPESKDNDKDMRGNRRSPLPYSSPSSTAVRIAGVGNQKHSMKRPADEDDDVLRPTMPTRPVSSASSKPSTSSTANTEKRPSDPKSISSFAPSANTEKRPSDTKSISSFEPSAYSRPQQEAFQYSNNDPLAIIETLETIKARERNLSKDSEKQKKKNIYRRKRNRRTRAQREKGKEQTAGNEEQDTVKLAQAISIGNGPAYITTSGNEGVDDHEFDILHSVSTTGHHNDDYMSDHDEGDQQEQIRPGAFAVKEGNARERTKPSMDNSADRLTLEGCIGINHGVSSWTCGPPSSLTFASQEQRERSSFDTVSGHADINPVPLTPPRTMRSEECTAESPPGRAIAESPGSQGRLRPRGTLTAFATPHGESEDQFPESDSYIKADSAAGVYNTAEIKWWMEKRTVMALFVVLLVVTVVAIAVPIAMSAGGGGGGGGGGGENEDQRRSDIIQVLSDVLGETEPQLGTDQHAALDFIVQTDKKYSTLSNPNKIRQRYSLAVFFFSTGGYTTWSTADNWLNEDLDECDGWEYITCYEGNVTTDVSRLVIEDIHLEGSLPTELAMLTVLDDFEIQGNEIFLDGSIPSFVYDMTQLKFLVLEYTGLKGALSSSLLRLSNLEWLSLNGNDFNGKIPRELPPKLELLRLDNNGLEDNLEEIINLSSTGTLPDLLILSLASNKLEGSIPSTIGLATKLEVLNLDDNDDISGIVPSEMGQLTALRKFSFEITSLSGKVPKEVCDLRPSPLEKLRCSELSCTPDCCSVTDYCPSERM